LIRHILRKIPPQYCLVSLSPFALSLSKGERFAQERLVEGRLHAIHASTSSARTARKFSLQCPYNCGLISNKLEVGDSLFRVPVMTSRSVSKQKLQTLNSEIRISKSEFRNSRGIVLIMVLWVITILSVIVLEFSFAMRTEVNIAKNFKEETQLYAIAEGGVQRAVAELIFKHDPRVQQKRKTQKADEVPPEKKEWMTDGRPYSLPFDQGKCEVKITSEAGKVNINIVSEATLRKIIGQLGLEAEARDMVVDSIMDWKDPDDFYRVNGAENDYYRSLKEPYDCKNGNLDSIEELLLVRGVTPDLFYGKKEKKKGEEGGKTEGIGLRDLFSIYSSGEQIDINSAPLPVLRVVLGIPSEVAQSIIKAREEKGFQNQVELLQRVPDLSTFIGEIAGRIVYSSMTSYYTIESKGKSKEGGALRGLKTIVKIDPREKEGYKVIQWIDKLI
jgi:general secretion pathway protein K